MTGWGEIENGEALMSEGYSSLAIVPYTRIVGSAMPERQSHMPDNFISLKPIARSCTEQ
jgi:hypothetical protein